MAEMTDNELYDVLFTPQQPPPLTEDQQALYDALYPPKPSATDGLTVEQASVYLSLYGDESVMGEPSVVDALESVAGDDVPSGTDEPGPEQ